MKTDMSGKICLVTGAARGIGKAVAERLAENGGDIVMMDINEPLLKESAQDVANRFGVKTWAIRVDATSTESITAAVNDAFAQAGTVQILANCAGVSAGAHMVDATEKDWDFVMSVNLKALFTFSKLVAKRLIDEKKKGHIVNISSQASKLAEAGNGVYCVSKAGVNMLTQTMGLELAPHGISVAAIAPGIVNTEMWQEVCEKHGAALGISPQAYHEQRSGEVPCGRLCEPGEVADMALYLASDAAEYVTGVTLTIAGGTTLI